MIIQYIKDGLDKGFKLPFALDGSTGKPSMTLWFAYVAFVLAVISIILVFFKDNPTSGAMSAISFFVICMVFYRLRKLDKVKIDLDDREIELDGVDESSEENN